MPATPAPVPTAPPRSQAQRILDLTRARDRAIDEMLGVKRLLGKIREAGFNTDDPEKAFNLIRQLLADDWSKASPPGRMFDLMRANDTTGTSGDGRVAEGVEFENGKAVLCWLGDHSSVNTYDSIDSIRHIHGHGGATEVVFRVR